MILDLDIGNTFIKWRCEERRGQWLTAELTSDGFDQMCAGLTPSRVRIASVADNELQLAIISRVRQCWGLEAEIAKTSARAAGVSNSYQDPSRMGVDRWLAMIAGYRRSRRACCVVDCGSAITVDYVDGQGVHLGGYIIPGLRLMRTGLLKNTSRVLVSSAAGNWQNSAPGRSTEEAVDHGICLLLDALAARIVSDYRRLLGDDAALLVTGGDGDSFRQSAGQGDYCPELVLDGLEFVLP